jgi:LuxR family transcriptional regulator, transcriptional regulator of spore coat protein
MGSLTMLLKSTAGREIGPSPHFNSGHQYRVAYGETNRVDRLSREYETVLQLDPVSGVPLLTAREQQVLELVAQGLSAKEIAQVIDIAPRTVERHIENVRLKTRARNRTHMVTLALEAGILNPSKAA